jgi:hypothetical protein
VAGSIDGVAVGEGSRECDLVELNFVFWRVLLCCKLVLIYTFLELLTVCPGIVVSHLQCMNCLQRVKDVKYDN